MLVKRVLREAPFSMRQLADDAGVNYGTLRIWASGGRTPEPNNVRLIAAGLRSRADRLRALAAELERTAG
jgi:transcriptional regulator with XRE-family HTH domain